MKGIQDIYPLTPMQEAMLLHSVGNPESTVLITQIVAQLDQDTNLELLESCWAQVIERHAALRTGFYWKGGKGPVQFVREQSMLNSRFQERKYPAGIDCDEELDKLLKSDMVEPLDLSKAPLMRVTYLIAESGSNFMIWTSHHLIFDRWCAPLIMEELEALYREAKGNAALAKKFVSNPCQFRSYIDFINAGHSASGEAYWAEYLADYSTFSPLTKRVSKGTGVTLAGKEKSIKIELSDIAGFSQLKSHANVTLASIAELTWALTIAKLTCNYDVLYGVTVAGRPSSLPGVEGIVGCFINNVPSRCVINSDITYGNLFDLQAREKIEREPHQHISLMQLNASLGASGEFPIDTLFLWMQDTRASDASEVSLLKIDHEKYISSSVFPLTVLLRETTQSLDVILKEAPGYAVKFSLELILNTYLDVFTKICGDELNTVVRAIPYFQFDPTSVQRSGLWRVGGKHSGTNLPLLNNRSKGREKLDRSYVKQVLKNEWRNVLCVAEFDSARSFFDLGGSSLDAAKLFGRLELMLRCSIPMVTLYRQPYLEDMVDVIVDNDWPLKPEVCIPIRETGTTQPLFCVASPDVNTIGFSQLANSLNDGIPVFVLQAPPESSTFKSLSPAELPELAERYVEAMKTVQPNGPYNLFGMCTGSQLSFEMAKILEKRGESCGLLAILNTWALFTVSRTYRLQQAYVRFKVLNEERLLDRPGVVWRRLIVPRLLRPAKRRLQQLSIVNAQTEKPGLANDCGSLSSEPIYPSHDQISYGGEDPNALIDEWVHVYGWHHLFKPEKKLQQKLTVFKLDKQPFWRINSTRLGWELHADFIETKQLDCDNHHNLLRDPWIKELAKSLEKCLLEKQR